MRFPGRKKTKRGIFITFSNDHHCHIIPLSGSVGGVGALGPSCLSPPPVLCLHTEDKVIGALGAIKCSLAFIYNVLERDVPQEISCRRESLQPRIAEAASGPPETTTQPRVGAHSHFSFMSLQLQFSRPNSANTKQIHPSPRNNNTPRLSS